MCSVVLLTVPHESRPSEVYVRLEFKAKHYTHANVTLLDTCTCIIYIIISLLTRYQIISFLDSSALEVR